MTIVCPCSLFKVITKAKRIENYWRLNLIGASVDIIGMRGNKTFSPLNFHLIFSLQ